MGYMGDIVVLASTVSLVISVLGVYYAVRLHINVMRRPKYSLAQIFLHKNRAVHAITLFVLSVFVFIVGRFVSFAVLLGVLQEKFIYTLRNPIDLTAATLFVVSLAKLYHITRR